MDHDIVQLINVNNALYKSNNEKYFIISHLNKIYSRKP